MRAPYNNTSLYSLKFDVILFLLGINAYACVYVSIFFVNSELKCVFTVEYLKIN